MKKAIFTLALLFVGVTTSNVFAQATTAAPAAQPTSGAQIEFAKEVHDYGTIENGADGSCEFKFKNTGTAPLIIQDAKGSCGCTVPSWPREPIAPGASSSIKVKYDTKRTGPINKSVTITSNASNTPVKVVRIKGTVNPAPVGTAPVNTTGAPTN